MLRRCSEVGTETGGPCSSNRSRQRNSSLRYLRWAWESGGSRPLCRRAPEKCLGAQPLGAKDAIARSFMALDSQLGTQDITSGTTATILIVEHNAKTGAKHCTLAVAGDSQAIQVDMKGADSTQALVSPRLPTLLRILLRLSACTPLARARDAGSAKGEAAVQSGGRG